MFAVLQTGKPNWRGVQLFRRTNRKMTNVQLLAFFTLQPLSLTFTSHSLPLEDNCNRTFFIFSIVSFLNLNILHTKIEDVFKKAFKSYILTN